MTIDELIVAMRAAVEAGYYPLDEYVRFVREHRRDTMSDKVERGDAQDIFSYREAMEELHRVRAENERLRATIADLKGKSFQQVLEENESLLDAMHEEKFGENVLGDSALIDGVRADTRPAYVKPSIRELKFTKGSTTP